MKRRLVTLASAVSLLLFLATVVLWARSYWMELRVGSTWEEREVSICIVRGHVALEIWDRWFHPEDREPLFGAEIPLDISSVEQAVSRPTDAYLRRLGRTGFYYAVESIPRDTWHWVVVPAWLPVTLLAMPLVFALRLFASCRPLRAGLCRCSYNLTGNTSGICPECGTTISQASRPL